jgi:hypothetical protein
MPTQCLMTGLCLACVYRMIFLSGFFFTVTLYIAFNIVCRKTLAYMACIKYLYAFLLL